MPCFICGGNLTKDEDSAIYCTDCSEEYVMVDSVKKLEESVVTSQRVEYEHRVHRGNIPCDDTPVLVQKRNLKRFVERSPEERERLDARNERARQRRLEKRLIEHSGEILKERETPNKER